MAPEVIGKLVYGAVVDFWSCGVLFYECAVRKRLFNGSTREEMFRAVTQSPIDISALQECSGPLSMLVYALLNRQPNLRLGFNGAHEIKEHAYFDTVNWANISVSDAPFKPSLWQQPMKQNIAESKRLYFGEDFQDGVSNPNSFAPGWNPLWMELWEVNIEIQEIIDS